MESILDWIRREGVIFRGGSGSGLNLSKLRSSKEQLTKGGYASGPVSFMRGADASARARCPQVGRQDTARGEDGRPRRRPPGHRGVHLVQGQGGAQGARPRAGQLRHVARLGRLGLDPVPEREQLGPRHGRLHGGGARGQGVEPDCAHRRLRHRDRRRRGGSCTTSRRPRGSAPTPASSTTRPSTRGTRARTPAASTRPTRARSTCTSTTPPATWHH